MRAASRRSLNRRPSQARRRALTASSRRSGTGSSGTRGGRMRAIGEVSVSPSSVSQSKKRFSARWRFRAVFGRQRAI